MFNRPLKTFRAFLLWTITLSLFLAFASFTFASQDEIDDVNKAIRAKGAQWLAGETSISKLSKEERKMRLGLIKSEAPRSDAAATPDIFSSAITTTAPPSFDWRNYDGDGWVTPVRNQGNCGSCWAFATTAALESNVMIATGMSIDRAEQILVSCSGAGSCNGGYIDRASNYISNTGLPPESYYPYTATNGTCGNATSGWQNNTSFITSWHYAGGTTSPTVDQIKNELITFGPLVTTMDVYSDFYNYYGGVYKHVTGTLQGGHAILIVGYDDVGQYFIVKNSWGSGWGESGYFRIAYSELNSVVSFGDWTIAYYTDTTPPSIKVTTPNGSESWEAGTTKTIQWSYTGNPGSTVRIDLYKTGALQSTIASSVSVGSGGSGSYSWKIPSTQLPGSDYQIKVTSTTNAVYSDTSDNNFAITAPVTPSITVTAPNNGGTWKVNTTLQISWNYTGSPGTYVKIELMKGTSVVKTISSRASIGTSGSGSYTWKIPKNQTTGTDYRVRITSTSNSLYTDKSDFSFSISK